MHITCYGCDTTSTEIKQKKVLSSTPELDALREYQPLPQSIEDFLGGREYRDRGEIIAICFKNKCMQGIKNKMAAAFFFDCHYTCPGLLQIQNTKQRSSRLSWSLWFQQFCKRIIFVMSRNAVFLHLFVAVVFFSALLAAVMMFTFSILHILKTARGTEHNRRSFSSVNAKHKGLF